MQIQAKPQFLSKLCLSLSVLGLFSYSLAAQAGLLVGHLTDKNGQAMGNAVMFATPLDTPSPAKKPGDTSVVAQENYAFSPFLTVIRRGTQVRFPNKDNHEHHLKSFSPAKAFELRVNSKKEEPAPIVFDQAGEVALVCHFHDWMRGFIYVVDTPYFSKTDASGSVALNNLPAGKYEVKAWAPNMFGEPLAQTVQVGNDGPSSVKFQFNFVPKAPPAPRNLSKSATFGYD
ncbi:carboxypeptidase regulatory-like domain-containing protein [Undibacterium sp. Ji42W]|uniref:carboxypeptidase regulatory-like domain-containing protein n=1 Tax=Undibacterium sp. Ji42W TaxID=3413039 RepID=UPI003BF3B7C2